MSAFLVTIYLSGALFWAITHGVFAADSVTDMRLQQAYQSDARQYAHEALHHFKALALTPIWPIPMLLSALSLLREMQDIIRKGGS